MDFQYCDRCGEMMSAENNDPSLRGEVLCNACRSSGDAANAPAEAGAVAPTPNPDVATAPDPLNAPHPEPAPPTADERLTLSGVMQNEGLDLFSHDTIAMRKKEGPEKDAPAPSPGATNPGSTNPQLQMNIEDALGDPMGEGSTSVPAGPDRPIPLSEMGSLDLPPLDPSSQQNDMTMTGAPGVAPPSVTMLDTPDGATPTATQTATTPAPAPTPAPTQAPAPAVKAGDEFFDNPGATAVAPAPAAEAPAGQAPVQNDATNTARPSSSGDRWRVDCVHCSAKLALPVVNQKSKLRCPRCTQVLVIMPTGEVRGARTQGSLAIPKGSEAFAQFDMGSTVTRRKEKPNPGVMPPITPPGLEPQPESAPPAPAADAMSFEQFSAATDAVEQVSKIVRPDDPKQALPAGHGIYVEPKPEPAPGATPTSPVPAPSPAHELQSVATEPVAEEHDHAAALLGSKEPPVKMPSPKRPRAATTVPVDNMVLWILIAAVPTFVGLMLASDIVSPRVEAICETIGAGVKQAAQGFYEMLGK